MIELGGSLEADAGALACLVLGDPFRSFEIDQSALLVLRNEAGLEAAQPLALWSLFFEIIGAEPGDMNREERTFVPANFGLSSFSS